MLTRLARIAALMGAAATALTGCATEHVQANGQYANPVFRAPVTANPTPYSAALVCLNQYARANHLNSPRIAIGRIDDKTGAANADGSGRQITMGAPEMAMTAFGKAGANLVERYDTSIPEMELKYSNNKLITDNPGPPGQANDYRKIYAGQYLGSDYAIEGAITELNSNIYSSGGDASAGRTNGKGVHGVLGARKFVMNVAVDLRVVETVSEQVVDVISYQKQIVAEEDSAGLFDVLGGNLYDLSAGASALEPKQLAVRAVIERMAVEIMANFYGMPGPQACVRDDPIGDRTSGTTGSFVPAYNNLRTNNAQSREDPDRWNSDRDSDVPSVRRGGY